MTQHIGIVAGSAEGAALCYRTIGLEAPAIMGEHNHPEITMNSMPMAEHMPPIRANDWEAVAELLAASAHKVARAGADFAICPDNTYYQAFKYLIPKSPIPWLHIAGAVAEEAQRLGYLRLGILGTKYLVESDVYPEALEEFRIERETPDEVDREKIGFASRVGDRSWNEVGTTCGSGWVTIRLRIPSEYVMPIIDPPATAGGTDFTATRSMSFEAKLKRSMRLFSKS